jgi:hypothetical protein
LDSIQPPGVFMGAVRAASLKIRAVRSGDAADCKILAHQPGINRDRDAYLARRVGAPHASFVGPRLKLAFVTESDPKKMVKPYVGVETAAIGKS